MLDRLRGEEKQENKPPTSKGVDTEYAPGLQLPLECASKLETHSIGAYLSRGPGVRMQ